MAVVKLTRSKKAVLFIDDDGHVFQTSVLYLAKLMSGELQSRYPFILLTRLPFDVTPDHFKKSPVYGESVVAVEELTRKNDALSASALKGKEEARGFVDKPVEW